GVDLHLRLQALAEIAPMHCVGIDGEVMVAALPRLMFARSLRHRRRDERNAAGADCGCAAGRREGGFHEGAPLMVERLLELPFMSLVIRTGPVVSDAHDLLSSRLRTDRAQNEAKRGGRGTT